MASRHARADHVGGRRPAEEETLAHATTELAKHAELLLRLDPLGDDRQPERAAQGDDRPGERPGLGIVRLAGLADQLAGDLEAVDREPAQVGERRVPRPEVVHGDPDTELAEGVQRHDRRLGIAEHGGLGHLEGQDVRVDPRVADLADDLLDEARMLQLEGREVDAQAEVLETRLAMPFDDLPGRRLEHEPAEGEDRVVLLGQVDELGRVDRSAHRVVPADERLDADDASAVQLDDRLVVDPQVAATDALAEVRGERVPLDDGAVHRRIEHLDPALALGLCPVHRDVRVAEQFVGRLVALRPR